MNQKAAAGKAPASKSAGGKPVATRPTGSKPSTPGPASRKPGTGAAPSPAQKKPPMDAATVHNRERQRNPTNERFWNSRGYDERPADWKTMDPAAGPKRS